MRACEPVPRTDNAQASAAAAAAAVAPAAFAVAGSRRAARQDAADLAGQNLLAAMHRERVLAALAETHAALATCHGSHVHFERTHNRTEVVFGWFGGGFRS